jgi:glycosyltransferase involved in cell wall biosynthesis
VLVSTSVREGWGLNVSEAALLGTASVGYRVPGLVDSVPASGGLLCDPTPAALAGAVRRVVAGEITLRPRRSTVPWTELSDRFWQFATAAMASHRVVH